MLAITEFSIRLVQSSDLDAISRLEDASFKDPYPPYFLSQLAHDNPETFLVATINDKPVGYAVVESWGDHHHLISSAVNPDHRRKGVGRKLLNELERRLPSDRSLKLEVRKSNREALELYLKDEFRQTDVSEGYYADGEDAIIMEKRLIKAKSQHKSP